MEFPSAHKWLHDSETEARNLEANIPPRTMEPGLNSKTEDRKVSSCTTCKDQPESSETWLWNHKEVLFIALSQLIIEENDEARAAGGEPVLVGKNLDLVQKDVPKLYYYFNQVSSEISDFGCDKNCMLDCTYPNCLLIDFREAGREEQIIMSLRSFARMKDDAFKGKFDHWINFDFDKLCEFWSGVVEEAFFGRKDMCSDILSVCSQRRGRYCSKKACSGDTVFDETFVYSLTNFGDIRRYHQVIEDALKGNQSSIEKALIALAKAKEHCVRGLEGLGRGLVLERDNRRDMGKLTRSMSSMLSRAGRSSAPTALKTSLQLWTTILRTNTGWKNSSSTSALSEARHHKLTLTITWNSAPSSHSINSGVSRTHNDVW